MPVYLCQPGRDSEEPWRHGVQVYARPFRMDDDGTEHSDGDGTEDEDGPLGSRGFSSSSNAASFAVEANAVEAAVAAPHRGMVALRGESTSPMPDARADGGRGAPPPPRRRPSDSEDSDSPGERSVDHRRDATRRDATRQHHHRRDQQNRLRYERHWPVRRVRHAELVLVDRAIAAHGRCWLRLRWPGPHGGFGGYVALGRFATQGPNAVMDADTDTANDAGNKGGLPVHKNGRILAKTESAVSHLITGPPALTAAASAAASRAAAFTAKDGSFVDKYSEARMMTEEHYPHSDGGDDPQLRPSFAAAVAPANVSTMLAGGHPYCVETELYYPTCAAMKLLAAYDDGLKGGSENNGGDGDEDRTYGLMGGGGGDEDSRKDGADGNAPGAAPVDHGEPVFCRICREGLHDVNYDLETVASSAPPPPKRKPPPAELEDAAADALARTDGAAQPSSGAAIGGGGGVGTPRERSPASPSGPVDRLSPDDDDRIRPPPAPAASAAAQNHAPLVVHHPTAENPLLAPCSCTGSMAFVHYLCIEQWRYRSRHPAARNGLRCETCGSNYSLPPPPPRPASHSSRRGGGAGVVDDIAVNNAGGRGPAEDDWLDAMPAHVLAALRRPHPWWQLGAAVVRRRYLRPFVPVFVSPLVALYCRARRTLKKRGVSRRRWACSLCRRRARWKCVRCLRSYYCSRQCQNVSWHIVHKHVCYKPARFWWSVVVYSAALVAAVPGILKDPLVYDLMISFVPLNFFVMGILGGGIATTSKRFTARDIRGRALETIVVLLTLLLTAVTWGLVRGFFGDASQCWGLLASSNGAAIAAAAEAGAETEGDAAVLADESSSSDRGTVRMVVSFAIDVLLRSTRTWFVIWDDLASKTGYFANRWICTPEDVDEDGGAEWASSGCFPSVRRIDPEFYLASDGGDENGDGERCVADMKLVGSFWALSAAFLAIGAADRHRRGRRQPRGRQHAQDVLRPQLRPHQD